MKTQIKDEKYAYIHILIRHHPIVTVFFIQEVFYSQTLHTQTPSLHIYQLNKNPKHPSTLLLHITTHMLALTHPLLPVLGDTSFPWSFQNSNTVTYTYIYTTSFNEPATQERKERNPDSISTCKTETYTSRGYKNLYTLKLKKKSQVHLQDINIRLAYIKPNSYIYTCIDSKSYIQHIFTLHCHMYFTGSCYLLFIHISSYIYTHV